MPRGDTGREPDRSAFYSILYPTREQESLSKRRDWLTRAKHSAKLKKEYALRGNKLVLAVPKASESAAAYPALYADIYMDQILDAVCRGPDAEQTKAYYLDFCCDSDMLAYRHGVFAALFNEETYALTQSFCHGIEAAQNALGYAARATLSAQRDRYVIDAVYAYGSALRALSSADGALFRGSEGLCAFAKEAARAAEEPGFRSLYEEVLEIRREMDGVEVRVEIHPGAASVGEGQLERDYTRQIRQNLRADSLWQIETSEELREIRLFHQRGLNHLEARVLERVMDRHPRVFERMRRAAARADGLIPESIARFAREIRFYTAFIALMNARSDLTFALPEESGDDALALRDAADLALALTGAPVTPNDIRLLPGERGVIVTGANQGGKTTFARTVGQVVVMTMLGLPVCCAGASLPLYRRVFSVFSEAEDSTVDNGKLVEECARLKPVLAAADGETFVVLNEIFSSTTARDALNLTVEVLDGLIARRARVLCVTHIHGIRAARPGIVGMATGAPGANGERDYRITRSLPDGNAYARDIASRYGLTADNVRRRVRHEN